MSLDTILMIGNALKHSNDKMKYFKYVLPCSKAQNRENLFYLNVPIEKDFSYQWNDISILPQKKIDTLYFLNCKVSDQDSSSPKYIYGDIYYNCKRLFDNNGKIKPLDEKGGNFSLKKDSFDAASKIRNDYVHSILKFIDNDLSISRNTLQDEIIKSIINDYVKNEYIEIFDKYPILKFWRSFYQNRKYINQCLHFAPVINCNNIGSEKIINDYCQFLLDNKRLKLPKSVRDKNINDLSSDAKQMISQFAEHRVFIHFSFADKQWYDVVPLFSIAIDLLNQKAVNEQYNGLLVPSKSIYRTLCSGNSKNDIQFPQFKYENSYKSFAFRDREKFDDFLYTRLILERPKKMLYQTQIGLFIFPRMIGTSNFDTEAYENFYLHKASELELSGNNQTMFSFLNEDDSDNISCFDLVFSDTSGNTIKDLIEISGVNKSMLIDIRNRISSCELEISVEKMKDLGWENRPNMNVERSFANLFGNPQIREKKIIFEGAKGGNPQNGVYPSYRSHMIRVMPLIYTNRYNYDELLLDKLIEKVEYSIRNVSENNHVYDYSNYYLLKYDLKLLYSIQNNKVNKFMEIINSESYQIGLLLGLLARNLSLEINSFEKNYVGNLSRRIGNLSELIRFKIDIEQKLIMHDKAKYTHQISYDLSQNIKNLKMQYNKDECAFGFFESYFMPIRTSNK